MMKNRSGAHPKLLPPQINRLLTTDPRSSRLATPPPTDRESDGRAETLLQPCGPAEDVKTTPRRGAHRATKGRRRPPHHTNAARKPHIYMPERRSGDSPLPPPKRPAEGEETRGYAGGLPSGETKPSSDSPLSTVERGRVQNLCLHSSVSMNFGH